MQPPIPGPEVPLDLRRPTDALAQFYRAFNSQDLRRMEEVWEHSPEAVVISPLVGLVRGWEPIRAGYARRFAGPLRFAVEFYDYGVLESGDLFCAIGRERELVASGTPSARLAARSTNLLRRDRGGRWRLLHHHVSSDSPPLPPMEDPTGPRAALASEAEARRPPPRGRAPPPAGLPSV
jgi:ketosteroid isomerase-like protein